MIFHKLFWLDATERAIKTMAQVMLSVLTVGTTTIIDVDWRGMLAAAVTAGLISILTSVLSASARDRGSASLVVNPPTPKK